MPVSVNLLVHPQAVMGVTITILLRNQVGNGTPQYLKQTDTCKYYVISQVFVRFHKLKLITCYTVRGQSLTIILIGCSLLLETKDDNVAAVEWITFLLTIIRFVNRKKWIHMKSHRAPF